MQGRGVFEGGGDGGSRDVEDDAASLGVPSCSWSLQRIGRDLFPTESILFFSEAS